MIRMALGSAAAVAVLALAIHFAATPWAFPMGLLAGGIGCLMVARTGSLR